MATCVDVSGAEYPGSSTADPFNRWKASVCGRLSQVSPWIANSRCSSNTKAIEAFATVTGNCVATGPDGPWELYNLKADRTEQHDLAAQHPDKVRQLLGQWETWARRANAIPWIWKPPYGEPAKPGQVPEKPKKIAKRRT